MRVIAFYSFFNVSNPRLLKERLNLHFLLKQIKGSIIVRKEGLNGTIAVSSKLEKKIIDYLMSLGVTKENIKISDFNGQRIFNEFKIKLKKEIVTSDFGLKISDIKKSKFIEPSDWDKFANDKNVEILDTRNDYEFKIGHYKNAINPKIETFKDFKNYIKNNKEKFQNKKVGIYCTGGIRCEKASNYLHNNGFKNVYMLKGGIINYFNKTDPKKSNWKGECFVFDNRVTIKKNTKVGNYGICNACRLPISKKDKKSKYYKIGLSCPKCYDKLTSSQITRFTVRHKQLLNKKIPLIYKRK